MTEEWRAITGFEDTYMVSSLGRVKSLHRIVPRKGLRGVDSWKTIRERILAATPDSHGYPTVSLKDGAKARKAKVHILVAETFIGPCPPGEEVRHGDGKRDNPRLANLCYGTRRENMADAMLHGTMRAENNGNASLTNADVLVIRAAKGTVHADDLGTKFDASPQTIRNIWARRTYASVEESTP